ncbi:ilvB operon leader peptide IvbL [Citrobacter sp. Cf116]|nr:ilvB operon leader peptide IvbL [Citrobacter sp. Cf116]MDM3345727.1 ilvB operon leader peptide IvbL [Citrobacter sp. Cf116]
MNPSMLTATLLKTAPSRAAFVVRVVVVVVVGNAP